MIIAISGKIGSGKDTIGLIIKYLIDCKLNFDLKGISEKDFIDWLPNSTPYHNNIKLNDWEIKKYANKLKEITCLLTGCTLEQLEDQSFKLSKLGPEWDGSYTVNTYRDLLQILGTECGREIIHPNIWVNALFADYQKESIKWDENGNSTLEDYPKWIITDLRFPNELEAVKQRNGITIRINRPGLVESNHLSETSLDSATFDFIINNDKDIEHLINEVRKILEKLSII